VIQIDEELWEMYHGSSVLKQLYIVFPNITLDNSKIFDFSMEESLSSDTDMLFGSCEAAQFRARVEGVGKDIVGQKCQIYHIVAETHRMPLGTYIIDSVSKKDDLGYREIIGYDEIYTKLDTDVTAWYKSLSFPIPLRTLRQSLFAYVGIAIIEQELILDNLQIERTIEPQVLNGRDVAQAIGELNGTFGHIGRDGKFKYVHLGSTGLYPAEDLYPSEELFPAEADSIFESSTVFSCTREEYEVAGIDCLQIRQEEGDVGSVIYDTIKYTNPYIVTGNFLVYGKTAEQLEEIGRTLFNYIKNTSYTPYTAKIIGLPYLEVGDGITFTTKKDNFLSFVMKRKLTGIQSLKDEISASGNQRRDNEVSPNMEIEMLKGRATVIQKSVEGIKVTVTDLEANTNSKFEQTANRITAEVASINKDMSSRFEITNNRITQEVTDINQDMSSRFQITNNAITAEVQRATGAEGQLSSKIIQTASEIRSEVKNTTDGLSSRISQTASSINLSVSNGSSTAGLTITVRKEDGTTQTATGTINMTGLVTFSNLSTSGQTTINGANITTGIVKAERIEADRLKIKAANVTGTLTIGQLPSNVAELGDIPSEYDITTITENTISTTNIVARNLKVKSANITGTITADFVEASGIKAGTISGVSLNFTSSNAVFWTTDRGEWTCDSNAIYTGNRYIQIYTDGNARFEGTVYADGIEAYTGRFSDWCYSPDWTNGSDRRIKEKINYEDGEQLAKIVDALKPVTYYMTSDKKHKLRFGFIAQDVKEVIDEMYGQPALYSYSEQEDIYSLSYNDIIAPIVAKIHFLQKEIDDLKRYIN